MSAMINKANARWALGSNGKVCVNYRWSDCRRQ